MFVRVLFCSVFCLTFAALVESQLTDDAYAKSLNKFSYELLQKTEIGEKNVVCSPYSVAVLLSMLLKGAEGKTVNEIKKLLHLENVKDNDLIHLKSKEALDEYRTLATGNGDRNVTLELANLLLTAVNYAVKPEYKSFIESNYKAFIDDVDFGSDAEAIKNRINAFVSEKTHGEIKTLLDKPLPPSTVAFLLNAIYFKGTWKTAFNVDKTKKLKFTNFDKTESNVDTMTEANEKHTHHINNEKKVSLLELPYDGNMSMILIVPHELYGIKDVLNALSHDDLESLIKEMKSGKVSITLPKFKYNYEADLMKLLEKVGLKLSEANLAGIAPRIEISDARHKAVITVDEAGTTAAAVSSITMVTRIGHLNRRVIHADRAFAYIIRDNENGLNLFLGVVSNLK